MMIKYFRLVLEIDRYHLRETCLSRIILLHATLSGRFLDQYIKQHHKKYWVAALASSLTVVLKKKNNCSMTCIVCSLNFQLLKMSFYCGFTWLQVNNKGIDLPAGKLEVGGGAGRDIPGAFWRTAASWWGKRGCWKWQKADMCTWMNWLINVLRSCTGQLLVNHNHAEMEECTKQLSLPNV